MFRLFSAVRAGILASLPFLYATLDSATRLNDCGQYVLTTPCLDAPLADHGLLVAAAGFGYEALARFVPSANDYSLVTLLGKLLEKIAPNRRLSSYELAT